MKIQPIAEVTDELIQEWKAKHGKVYKLEVAKEATTMDPHMVPTEIDEMPKCVGYIRKPDNKTLNFASQKLPMFQDAGKVIIKSCWLGGDEELKKDGPISNAAAMQVMELIEIHQGRLKEV